MTRPLHCLVIGTGAIGQRHIRHLMELSPDCQLSFLRRDRLPRRIDDLYKATIETDIELAILAAPDLAIIASPSACHIDVLPRLIEANIPLYVEKPVVVERSEVTRIHAALEGADPTVPRVAGFNFRYLPSLVKLSDVIHSGGLGQIVRAHLSAGQWLPDWRPRSDYRQSYSAKRDLGGGVLLDLIHEIDLCRLWFGEPTSTQAIKGHFSRLELNVEDSFIATLGFPEGPIVSIGLDYVARQRLRRYEIIGDDGTAIWDLSTGSLRIERSGGVLEELGVLGDFDINATYPDAMTHILSQIDAWRDGALGQMIRSNCSSLSDGLESSSLAIRLKEASSGWP